LYFPARCALLSFFTFEDIEEITMKKFLVLSMVLSVLAAGCAPKAEKFVLKEGTPAFQLAKDLAAKVPSLDPAAGTVLVRAKGLEITAGEVIQAILDNIGTRATQLTNAEAAQIRSVIERGAVQLGEKKILLAAAVKAKTVVAPAELEKAIKAEYERAGGEQGFLDALKSNGLTIDYVKKSIEEQMIINSFLEGALMKTIKIAPQEIEKAYAEEKTASVRHILLLTQGKTEEEKTAVRKKMEEILAKAKAGEDFSALAAQYSEDPGSKDKGGLYEDFEKGSMVKPFEDAAFTIPVGELSGIVETSYGYHILKIVDRKKETKPLDEVRGEIESKLKQDKQTGAFTTFMAALKKKTSFKTVGF
jgi:parvulin-like peptidyl-prolyl isomerase